MFATMNTILLFLLILGSCVGDEPKFVLNFDSEITVCPDETSQGFLDTSEAVPDRNESHAFLRGSLTFNNGLDENSMVEVKVYKEGAGGRSEMIFSHEVCNLCGEVGNTDSFYHKYLKYFGFPEKCPFEAGKYHIHDMVVDTTDLPINSANCGRYHVVMNIHIDRGGDCKDDLVFVGCAKFDFVIEADYSRK